MEQNFFMYLPMTQKRMLRVLWAYKLNSDSIIASKDILQSFHQPSLPSIYIADRYEWIGYRGLSLDKSDMKKINSYLKDHTKI